MIQSGFEELDDDERLGWEEDFEAERQQWREHTDS
jgi:hypothetical protein